ncbi:uncharacterized protein [Hyperolius riggenbachi]|uniref:uncharacterized protein n=1 Tax=Hyperolius riggenbachi TaxID=752182 RepID=UPI0035A2D56F
METPNSILLLLLVGISCTATGTGEVRTYHVYGRSGSSVVFPAAHIDRETVFDLKRSDGTLIVSCHGTHSIREPYTRRSKFYPHNGTFLLTNLTKRDSGTYVQEVNMTRTAKINLLVIDPVSEPDLTIWPPREDDGRCLIMLTCQGSGDGHLNITIRIGQEEIAMNITREDNSTTLSLNGRDPKSAGIYSCIVANRVSSQNSMAVELLPPVTRERRIMADVAIGLLVHWGVSILSVVIISCIARRKTQNRDNDDAEENRRRSETSHILRRSFTCADILFGGLKEIAVIYICVQGVFLQAWWSIFPAFLLLFRIIFSVCQSISSCTGATIPKALKRFCTVPMHCSNMAGVPAFCIYVIVVYMTRYDFSCEADGVVDLILVLFSMAATFVLLWIIPCIGIHLYEKNRGEARQTGVVNNNDVKQPIISMNSLSTERHSEVPNVGKEAPKNEDSCVDSTEQSPEEQEKNQTGQNEELQPLMNENTSCTSALTTTQAPNHKEPEVIPDTERQCLLPVKEDAVAPHRESVSNG